MTLSENKLARRQSFFRRAGVAGILLPLGLICAGPVQAEEDISVSAHIGLYSDYRFRGISFNSNAPTIQAGADIAYGGFSAGLWGSGLTLDLGNPNNAVGNNAFELDIYGFYSHQVGPVGLTGGVVGYLFFGPELDATFNANSTVELWFGASYDVLPTVSVATNLEFDPTPDFLGVHLGVSGSWAISDSLSLDVNFGGYPSSKVGYYDQTFDYGIALGYTIASFNVGLGWYGNDGGPSAAHDGNIVFSVSLAM